MTNDQKLVNEGVAFPHAFIHDTGAQRIAFCCPFKYLREG